MKWVGAANIIRKGEKRDLTIGLTSDEFDCQCTSELCHFTLINPYLIQAFYETRQEFGEPIKVNSGFRCQSHNIDQNVQGKKHSYHTMGMAIDIRPVGNVDLKKRLEQLERIAREHFNHVIPYPTFIHCDMRPRESLAEQTLMAS